MIPDTDSADHNLINNEPSIFKTISDNAVDGKAIADLEGRLLYINRFFANIHGYEPDELLGKNLSLFHNKRQIEMVVNLNATLIKQGRFAPTTVWHSHKDGTEFPMLMSGILIRDDHGKPRYMACSAVDLTEQNKIKKDLEQIQWMLSTKKNIRDSVLRSYGDLTEMNKNGLILSSIGKDQLMQISSEFLDLLETSSAIYEKNGDYAIGMFSSSWCRLMDNASRELCRTDDNQKALSCGKWLCHESCWQDASKIAIENGKTVDIKCTGGLRLYAVPIFANDQVIGAINFGYGEPPDDHSELQKLSDLYQIPIEEMQKARQEYQVRPQFIIDHAK